MQTVQNLCILKPSHIKEDALIKTRNKRAVASQGFSLPASPVESELWVTLVIAHPIPATWLLLPWEVVMVW